MSFVRFHALLWFYLSVIALGLWGMADYAVDVNAKAQEELLLRGTWNQYATQLMTEHGYWAMAANYAVVNTYPSLETERVVLED